MFNPGRRTASRHVLASSQQITEGLKMVQLLFQSGGHHKKFEDGLGASLLNKTKPQTHALETRRIVQLLLTLIGSVIFLSSFGFFFSSSATKPSAAATTKGGPASVQHLVETMQMLAKNRRFIEMDDVLVDSMNKHCFPQLDISLSHQAKETFHFYAADFVRGLATGHTPPVDDGYGVLADGSISPDGHRCPLLDAIDHMAHNMRLEHHEAPLSAMKEHTELKNTDAFSDAVHVFDMVAKLEKDGALAKVELALSATLEKHCTAMWGKTSHFHLITNAVTHTKENIVRRRGMRNVNWGRFGADRHGHVFDITHAPPRKVVMECSVLTHLLNM